MLCDTLDTPLCFGEASSAKARGDISEDEYFRHLFVHFEGVKHPEDDDPSARQSLENQDVFAYFVYLLASHMEPIEDATAIYDIFKSYRENDDPTLVQQVSRLESKLGRQVLKCLAILALQERRALTLKFCLDHGFTYEWHFARMADRVQELNDDPATCEALEGSQFRQMIPLWIPPPDVQRRNGTPKQRSIPPKRNANGTLHADQLKQYDREINW